jgi:hypothetical protein
MVVPIKENYPDRHGAAGAASRRLGASAKSKIHPAIRCGRDEAELVGGLVFGELLGYGKIRHGRLNSYR